VLNPLYVSSLSALIVLCSVFVVNFSNELPEEMTSFVRLLMMSVPEWEKAKGKSKLPKPKVNDAVLTVVADVVRRRLGEYPTAIEAGSPEIILSKFLFTCRILQHDETLLVTEKEKVLPLNLMNAVVVRLGEKRILHGLLQVVTCRLEGNPSASASESRKRKADGTNADGRRAMKRL
jgi:SET domain-containing protein 6